MKHETIWRNANNGKAFDLSGGLGHNDSREGETAKLNLEGGLQIKTQGPQYPVAK